MNEVTKTSIFVGVALVLVAGIWFSRPAPMGDQAAGMRNKELFPEFDDPLVATSLEIVKYDEETGEVMRPFEVAQVDEHWSIPSHENYPADAEDQLADVATGLMRRKVLDVPSESSGDHAVYGVIDPDPETIKRGATGVGTRVIVRDAEEKLLVGLIIGASVEDADEDLHYVRQGVQRSGNKVEFLDPVFIVSVKTDKLSTRFEDWIEKDLLKLTPSDIREVRVDDYASTVSGRGELLVASEGRLRLGYDDLAETKWSLLEDLQFDRATSQWVPVESDVDRELDKDKLNDLKRAVDDLKIVDVARKPEGLSGDLKTGDDFKHNIEAAQSLITRGFYPADLDGDGQPELLATEGDFRVLMKDGVEYLLRFGNLALRSESGQAADGETDQTTPEEDSNVNRYLFVMAEFNPDGIEKPEFTPLPEFPAEKPVEQNPPTTTDPATTDPATPDPVTPDPVTPDPMTPDPVTPDPMTPDPVTPDPMTPDPVTPDPVTPDPMTPDPVTTDPATPDPMTPDPVTPDPVTPDPMTPDPMTPDPMTPDPVTTDPMTPDPMTPDPVTPDPVTSDPAPIAPATTDPAAGEPVPTDGAEGPEGTEGVAGADGTGADAGILSTPEPTMTAEEHKQACERIEKENQRKEDEYQAKIAEGKKHVEELNARFADWYYVISDSVYQKIHLGRDDVLKPKEPEPLDPAASAMPMGGQGPHVDGAK